MALEFDDAVENCLKAINNVPVNQIRYYLLLTLNSLKKEDPEQNQEIIAALTKLTLVLQEFLNPENLPPAESLLEQINQSYEKLCELSRAYRLSVEIGYALINLGSAILALITGTLGALTGATIGFFRALFTLNNPFCYLADGFVTGLAFGGAVGFRAPKKLLKNEFTRQLRFCINGIDKAIKIMQEETARPFSFYEEKVKKDLLSDCFKGDEEAFQAFLTSENQNYQIVTVPAHFLSKNLEGFLGHHARIIINLPNQKQPKILEFSSDESGTIDERELTQKESRVGSGSKLVEMIALHEQLLVTEPCTLSYMVTEMKAGDNDCFSYVNKILVGTNQEATKCRRFNKTENCVGRFIGFFVKGLSPFPQEILDGPTLVC